MLQVILLAAQMALGQPYEVTVGTLPPRYTVTVGQLPPRTDKDPFPKGYWRPEWPQPKWEPLPEQRRAPEAAQPRPFSEAGEPEAADEADVPAGRWEWSDADVPEYMERYQPAKYTQEIAVTNGRDRISPVSRMRLEEKWRVPGGMVGLRGWSSALYSWAPRTVTVGNIQVLNSFGYFQPNRGYKARYEPGTEFLDVLTNTDTGKVFEVRKAMKTEAGWQRFVTYRRASERPRGYHGLKSSACHSCHSEAGTGGYGVALVPGGDTVLSVGFAALEPSE